MGNYKFLKKEGIKLFVAILCLLLVSCSNQEDDSYTGDEPDTREVLNPVVSSTPLDERDQAYIYGDNFAVSFGITELGWVNLTFDPNDLSGYEPFFGQINLTYPDDILEATLSNISNSTANFMLKLFLNYEEIPFRVLGEDKDYVTEFIFPIDGGYQLSIPFVLNSDFLDENEHYKLTAAVFVDPELYAIDHEHLWASFAFANGINLDLFVGNGGELQLATTYNLSPLERIENPDIGSLAVWTDLDDFSLPVGIYFDDLPLVQALRGEELELSFIAGLIGPKNTDILIYPTMELPPEVIAENYVILALLDWQQIELNGEPYLFVYVEENDSEIIVDLGRFTITVPDEPGFYDFVAFIIPNANHENTFHSFFPLVFSVRFTIEVIE